ncbi:MAG: TIGR04282 family arsenosugar biosynthesis glycosyltransferase [Actinobacteria bacterium]|nr:TIGR04282 family arsenosugar biosynthesis glycosyltransferase [Actinomycetota bacterium]
MTETVLVVAKAPVAGRSKTRLVPPLSPEQAAALQEALLLDTLAACRAASDDVRLLCEADDATALAALTPDVPLVLQRGRGLAEALELGLVDHVGDGPCAIVASDIPGVPAGSLERAFADLAAGADLVLGPAHDGGYWLIAAREPQSAPFREIPWSTPAVAAVTRTRCAEAGLRLVELEPWRDVDTLVDLAALAADVDGLDAPRSVSLLGSLEGVVPREGTIELRSSELLAGSPWRAILRDTLRLNGRDVEYSYLGVPRAVFVAALTDDDELLLVRQYRHPVRDWTLEVPAGSCADGETPLATARRELREEAGATAAEWVHLSTFFSSSAHLSLRSDAFLALGATVSDPDPDEGENLTLVRMPRAEAIERARAGGFTEGQTALTILLAAEHLTRRDERSTR